MDKTKKLEDDIAKIDKNLEVKTNLEEKDIVFYDVKKPPFDLYGLYKGETDVFKRMPEEVAEKVSSGVTSLNFNTAGIRVRFSTDSDYVAIKCIMPKVTNFSHMPKTGTSGFDMYEVKNGTYTYNNTFVPPKDMVDGYESITYLKGKDMRCFEINFPLYNRVDELYIGIRAGSKVSNGEKYTYKKPILYYGSSVTQGGCASRPGNSYQSIISHDINADYINLGFSGSAKGEDAMADYLASLDVSLFVCDYDYNAPTSEYLRKTHLPLYKKYREKNPNTPIIFVSASKSYYQYEDLIKRKQVVFDTYMYAKENGDKNVSFIDGYTMFGGRYRDVYTVDGSHPNDAGFLRMADVIGREIEIMLRKD